MKVPVAIHLLSLLLSWSFLSIVADGRPSTSSSSTTTTRLASQEQQQQLLLQPLRGRGKQTSIGGYYHRLGQQGLELEENSIPTKAQRERSDVLGANGDNTLPTTTTSTTTTTSSTTSSPSLVSALAVAAINGGDASSSWMADLMERLRVGFYFGLWYALNVIYNIVNKQVLNVLPAPMVVASIQLGVGALYVALLWLVRLRAVPGVTKAGFNAVCNVGLFHAVGQLCTVLSLGAGPVSFTHIVKALEPFFSAAVSVLIFGKYMRPQVYATLIPVVCGVGYACLKERSFSWLAFSMAMSSNLAFALRAVLSKQAMTASVGSNMTATNIYGLVTLAAFCISVPLALIGEGQAFPQLWSEAVAQHSGAAALIRSIAVSGIFHYLNNEVMYLALSNVHPVTLAVGNTMKRVFIMVASVMVFRNEITVQAAIGSTVGICGVLLYSLTKQYYEKLEAAQQRQKQRRRRFGWRKK